MEGLAKKFTILYSLGLLIVGGMAIQTAIIYHFIKGWAFLVLFIELCIMVAAAVIACCWQDAEDERERVEKEKAKKQEEENSLRERERKRRHCISCEFSLKGSPGGVVGICMGCDDYYPYHTCHPSKYRPKGWKPIETLGWSDEEQCFVGGREDSPKNGWVSFKHG